MVPQSSRHPIRKRFAASFALCFVLVASGASAATSASSDTAPSRPGLAEFPTYGLSFTAPSGWAADPCPPLPDILRLAQFAPDTHQIVAQITIDSRDTPPFERDKLTEFAVNRGATVLPQGFEIDHAPAIAVRKDRRDDKSAAFLMLVANHGNRSYSFTVLDAGQLATHDLIELCKSVHWMPVENPYDHLRPDQPVSLFDGQATVQLPVLFRRGSASEKKDAAGFILPDAASSPVVAISFAFVPAGSDSPGIPDDTQLAAIRTNMLETAQKKWGLSDYPLLESHSPVPHGIATTLTKITSLTADARVVTTYNRCFAIFFPQGVTYVEYDIYVNNDDDAQKWDKSMLAITNSLAFAPAAATKP